MNLPVVICCALMAVSASAQTAKKKPGQKAPPPIDAPTPPGPDDVRAKVMALLSGYEYVPTAEDWKRVGPGALDVLAEIAADSTQLPTRRTRAVACMGQLDTPKASERLTTLVTNEKLEPQYRGTAIEALGAKLGDKALPTVKPFLTASNAELREATARTLSRMKTPEARKTLESRLEKEQDAAVRDAIQRGLQP
ncbi:MAG: HEAT repeat domain-containing protein [Myxococcaceae bacterium]